MAELKRPVRFEKSPPSRACGCDTYDLRDANGGYLGHVEGIGSAKKLVIVLNADPAHIAAETRRQCAVELDTILRNDDLDQPTQYAALRYLVSNWRGLFDKKPNL